MNNLIDSTMKSLKIEINKARDLQSKCGIYLTSNGHYIGELRKSATITYERLSIYVNIINNICKLLKQNEEYGNGFCFNLKMYKVSYDYMHDTFKAFMQNPLLQTYKIDTIITLLCECYFQSLNEFEKVNKGIVISNTDVPITILYLITLCKIGLPLVNTFEIDVSNDNFYANLKPSSIISSDLFIQELDYINDNESTISISSYSTSLPDLDDNISETSNKENDLIDITTIGSIEPEFIFDC